MAKGYSKSYGKKPLWQWLLIYLVIGLIIYGAVYYFVFAKKGTYNYGSTQQTPVTAETGKSVTISNYSFSPATLTIKVGDTVTWTNQDSMSHSATADDKSFDTGLLGQGNAGKITFKKAGTYKYHCSVHPNMRGTIIVK